MPLEYHVKCIALNLSIGAVIFMLGARVEDVFDAEILLFMFYGLCVGAASALQHDVVDNPHLSIAQKRSLIDAFEDGL